MLFGGVQRREKLAGMMFNKIFQNFQEISVHLDLDLFTSLIHF